jgi:hypothetical protein
VTTIGAMAWIAAVLAAAVAVRGAGAPVFPTLLLGLSVVVVSHTPPIGPIGLTCFPGAVALLLVALTPTQPTFRLKSSRSLSWGAGSSATTAERAAEFRRPINELEHARGHDPGVVAISRQVDDG